MLLHPNGPSMRSWPYGGDNENGRAEARGSGKSYEMGLMMLRTGSTQVVGLGQCDVRRALVELTHDVPDDVEI